MRTHSAIWWVGGHVNEWRECLWSGVEWSMGGYEEREIERERESVRERERRESACVYGRRG